MRLDGLWIRYGRRAPWVLRSVSATLAPGEVAVVHGRNGAGKSTLLSAVAGIRACDKGTIVDRPAIVGWVPERFPVAQPFTALAYLRHMAAIRRAPSMAIDAWVERLHLTPFLDTKLGELSKGSAQKVGLAQALLVRPGLLVLDEPWEGLDVQTRAAVSGIIAEVTDEGGIVLVSDHRGETVKLPHAVVWTVHDGSLLVGEGAPRKAVIEIAVDPIQADDVAKRLRADGHDVVAVRR